MALGGTAPWDFVDCQWTVHVKCQYDAAKRVRRSLKAQARDHALGNPNPNPNPNPNLTVTLTLTLTLTFTLTFTLALILTLSLTLSLT